MRDFDTDDFEFDASVFDMDDSDVHYTAQHYPAHHHPAPHYPASHYPAHHYRKRGGKAKKAFIGLLVLALLLAGGAFAFMAFYVRPPGDGRIVTLLVAGQDNVGEHGLSDTVMLVSLDTIDGHVHVVSIPRDTKADESWAIPKINSVYAMTGGSAERLRSAAEAITGFAVDNYIILDMQAFTDLVDLVGGVNFDVPRYMRYDDPCQGLHINLRPGYQRLDGEQALHFVRWRQNNDGTGYANGDLGRIAAQQDFMRALAGELLQIRNPIRINNMARTLVTHVETDLDLGNLVWFAQQFMGMDDEDIHFLMIPNEAASIGGIWYQVIQLEQWLAMVNTHLNPGSREVREENLRIWAWKDGRVQQVGAGLTLSP